MSAPQTGTRPTIAALSRTHGLRVSDPIESAQFSLFTPAPVDPDPCDTGTFTFPVDAAATIHTAAVETPYLVDLWVRDGSGTLVADSTDADAFDLPPGEYTVEFSSTPMKLYLRVEGSLAVETREDCVRLTLDGTDRLHVGARSFHERPAATVTTEPDPESLMTALSALGSALKTTSCERSFPTLRGHPPLVEFGERVDIPAGIESPDTGVVIESPPDFDSLYPLTSLIYYLGADVRPGPEPRIVTDDWTYSLEGPDGLAAEAGRVLRQAFLLDCVTRTEGYYQVDLHERRVVEERVDLDFAALYDQPLPAQLEAYLDVPYDAVAEAVPTWKLTADVTPTPSNARTLPFLANDLAVVRTRAAPGDPETLDVDELVRSSPDAMVRGPAVATRGAAAAEGFDEPVFRPDAADSIEQAYVGYGIPLGASKMSVEAYRRRLDDEPTSSARPRVVVVCNDPEMADENAVSEVYGTREWLEFDVDLRENLDRQELVDLLAEDIDFLHYIGHVDDEGLQCADGTLDARGLDDVGVRAFLLNACRSYTQGRALVESGSVGGLVTLADVLTTAATEVGRTVAHLLNGGFSLHATLNILDEHDLLSRHYMIVGDGNAAVVSSESGNPLMADVKSTASGYDVAINSYPTVHRGLGTFTTPYIADNQTRYLVSGELDTWSVSQEQLSEFLEMDSFPVSLSGKLFWSDSVDVDTI